MIVETGTVVTNANSLCDLAYADVYFEERNNTQWLSASDTAKEAALIKATDYIALRFGTQLKGVPYQTTQPLLFPRVEFDGSAIGEFIYDTVNTTLIIGVTIPTQVKRATCEYALRALTADLAQDKSNTPMVDTTTIVKVGSIMTEDSVSYPRNYQQQRTYTSYTLPDGLMKPYLKSPSQQLVL